MPLDIQRMRKKFTNPNTDSQQAGLYAKSKGFTNTSGDGTSVRQTPTGGTVYSDAMSSLYQNEDFKSALSGISDFGNNMQAQKYNPIRQLDMSQFNDWTQNARNQYQQFKQSNDQYNQWWGDLGEFGQGVAEFAKQAVGKPYVWGGTSPNGWDCSGMTGYFAKQMGVPIERTAKAQYNQFKRMRLFTNDMSQVQPGDLLYFKSSASPSGWHTGMYAGNGQMLHAAGKKYGTILSPLSDRRMSSFLGAGLLTQWNRRAQAGG